MHPLIESQRAAIVALARRHHVPRVRIFGSMARGDAGPGSDADFLVDIDEATTGFDLGSLLMDLQELLGVRVDVVTEAALHPQVRERALREAIQL